ncbi:MAG: YdcF family protein [Patescibacteria group bacterium]
MSLYNNGLIPKILLSGGINKTTIQNEAKKMAKNLIMMDVKKDDLILENQSTNSLENVLFFKDKIEKNFRVLKK